MLRPDPLHRAMGDANGLGQGTPSPMGHLTRRLAAGQFDNLEFDRLWKRWLARRSRPILQLAGHTLFGKPLLPAPNRRPAHTNRIGNRRNRPTIRRQQHDTSPLDMFVSPISISNDRLHPSTIITAKQNANCLCHGKAIASLDRYVNLMIESNH